MRVLKVDYGDMQKLAAECGCKRGTVSLALKGASSGPKARMVRALAIAKYNARMLREVELSPSEQLEAMDAEE